MNFFVSHKQLQNWVASAAECLPAQGPISAFAFLNPLQSLENLPFDEAMRKVKSIYGCEPYWDEGRYLEELRNGRICLDDLRTIVADDLGHAASREIAGLTQLFDFRWSLLTNSIHCGVDRELDWLIAETNALEDFRNDVPRTVSQSMVAETQAWIRENLTKETEGGQARGGRHWVLESFYSKYSAKEIKKWDTAHWDGACLRLMWEICSSEVKAVYQPVSVEKWHRHRDLLRSVGQVDCDQWVHEILGRFCAAFLDQGFAHWSLPGRHHGFFRSFCENYRGLSCLNRRWLKGLGDELKRIDDAGLSPLESIGESLKMLGVTEVEGFEFLRATLLALRGYSGMIWQTETRPDRVYISSPPGTLVEYLAVRLILDRLAWGYAARETLDYTGGLSDLKGYLEELAPKTPETTAEQQTFILFQLAQLSGWSPQRLAGLSRSDWCELTGELERFSSHERRRVFQAAYERKLVVQSLDAFSNRLSHPSIKPNHPRLQIVTCIDAREESFRRHLEELDSRIETFGIAGFFGVPMHYRGAGDAHFSSLAPIVVTPNHWVVEEPVFVFEDANRNRARARKMIGTTSHQFQVGTRGSLVGALVSTLLGPLATAPLLSRVLFPRLTGAIQRTARQFIAPPAITRLHLERAEDVPPSSEESGWGFTLAEMANMAELSLRDIGLMTSFARVVVLMGHGSSCLNNPHESAYHCGACAGSPGGPNARALAAMLNDLRVRRLLRERGIAIPEGTFFLGAMHNTATEEITFYDLELLPSALIGEFKWARSVFQQVAQRNAHERCRRFESASLSLTPYESLLHVQGRTEDLAQTRPEYGNSTNALCFVGRRSRIRGLFLDRRSFLMSYDPTMDDSQSSSLTRILRAVIPVCQGINSLYSFSAIDSGGWGSGTKLPHNVTSLLGVMDGAASDLRTGIPWQGIDIHEPMRLLFVIETFAERLLAIIEANPTLSNLFRHGWANFAVLEPDSQTIQQYVDGQFVPYSPSGQGLVTVESSFECYRGRRENLDFMRVVTQ